MSFNCLIFSGLFLLFFVNNNTQAQTENAETEEIIESLSDIVTEDYDYSELTERLNYYKRNPINLNKTSREELQELIFLSPLQINSLLKYPETNGYFIDILELQAVEGFDTEIIQRLLPFVSISSNPFADVSFKKMLSSGQHDFMLRYGQLIEKPQGFSDSDAGYLGTPQRSLIRYRYMFQNSFSAGITAEKDAGESFFAGKQKNGFDFYSGFIAYKGKGSLKKLIIGDYALQFGQGLALWSGLSFGKGASIVTIPKQDIGLRPYTSSNEALFFRGTTATLGFKNITLTPFASFRFLDATISADKDEVSSINQSGFHRTLTEISNKYALKELIYGAAIQYDYRSLKTGFIAYQTKFDHPFEQGKMPYNRYNFSASGLINLGWYYHYNWRNFYFFGESAHSLNSGFAHLTGTMMSVAPTVSLVGVYRNYQKDYYSFFNQAVAESIGSNENGFYSGILITPNSKLEISGYTDFFRFPWLKFGVDAPSKGYEFLFQLSYSPSKKLKALFRYKEENKEENDELENSINFLESVRKQNYRIDLNYKINAAFQIKNRVELVNYKKGLQPLETGYLLYQDIAYNPVKSKFSGNARFTIFDTRGFNTRVYAYETDVLYSFSTPGFQDKGLRIYFNGRYKIKKGMDIWFRYAVTSYINKDAIGSGLGLIKGNKQSDIKAQIRFQF